MGTVSPIRPKGKELPRRPRSQPSLTPEETRHLRASLKNLRAAFGTWGCLADAIGVSKVTLTRIMSGRSPGSGTLAWRAARASNLPMEVILGGGIAEAGACPLCKRKAVTS